MSYVLAPFTCSGRQFIPSDDILDARGNRLNRMEAIDLTRNHVLEALEALQVRLNAVKVELDGEHPRSISINTLGEPCAEVHSAFMDYSAQESALLLIIRGTLPDGETDEEIPELLPGDSYE